MTLRLCLAALLAQAITTGGGPRPAPVATENAVATAAISGVVVDGVTKAPLADILVHLSSSGRSATGQSRQLTDAKGRFAFVNLPAAPNYTVTAGKFGYLDGGFARGNTPSAQLGFIPLTAGQWVSNVRVELWRPGAISGTVTDERGEPVVGVYVRALARLSVMGRKEFAAGPVSMTDDRGMYRISGLVPGQYVVQVPSVQAAVLPETTLEPGRAGVTPEAALESDGAIRVTFGRYPLPPSPVSGRALVYPMTMHPNATSVAQATAIDLKYGDDRTSVDVRLEPAPAVRVSGMVVGPPEVVANLALRLLPAGLENVGVGGETATSVAAADGRFSFAGVPAGAYVLDASRVLNELITGPQSIVPRGDVSLPSAPGAPVGSTFSTDYIDSATPGTSFKVSQFRTASEPYSGRMSIEVGDRDLPNVTLTLRRWATLSGRYVIDPAAVASLEKPSSPAAPAFRFSARLDPAAGSPSLGLPRSAFRQDEGSTEFSIPGLRPGAYFLRLSGSPGWVAKSIRWKGKEYLDLPFDASTGEDFSDVVVTVTNAPPVLTGLVRGRDGSAAPGATVIAFPVDRTQWSDHGLWPLRIKAAVTDTSGIYRFSNLPAGEYLVVALDGAQTTAWHAPGFFKTAEGIASRVALTWAGQTGQDLTVREVR